MNELDVIRQFGTDVRDPDPAAIAGARAQLMEAMRQAGTPVIRRRRRRRWTLATAAASAAIVIALLVPALLPGGTGEASASETLLRLANLAGEGPAGWESAAKGEYVYTKTLARWPTCTPSGCVLEDVERETWVGRDGKGRIVEIRDGQRSDETFSDARIPYRDLAELLGHDNQGDVRAFVQGEVQQADMPEDVAMFAVIGHLLGETTVLPEIRKKLLRLAATLPSSELLGETTDELGRVGIGVGYTWAGVRMELIFNPDTSLVLSQRFVSTVSAEDRGSTDPEGSAPSDAWIPGSWAVYVDSGITDSVTERPSS